MKRTRNATNTNVVNVKPKGFTSMLYPANDRNVARTLFHASETGKKAGRGCDGTCLKVERKREADIRARMAPAQKGRKPGPGSFQAPISTVRAYKAKKQPTPRKKTAAMRL
jgi:hypothetical protein